MKSILDKIFKKIFAFFAFVSIVSLVLITVFIVIKGIIPFFNGSINFWDFITGMRWNPNGGEYGVGFMIFATFFSTLIAMIIAIPLSLLSAVAINELLSKRLRAFVTGAIELLAGIPSIIYGVIGLAVIVPFILQLHESGINPYSYGNSLLAASLVLAIMTMPTIIAVSLTALKAVPSHLKEASYGLGANKIQTIFKICIPSAKSGIIAAIILGIGRAIGETIAVVMVAGNVSGGFSLNSVNEFLFQGVRPLTANIAVDISYASGVHKDALFATALVLFFFIFVLNITVQYISKRGK